jgi:signal transduction histidine kinase
MAALGRLAAGVAHELNNPVGALNSSSDVSARCVQEISKALPRIGTVDGVPHSPRTEDALRILEENQQIVQRAGKRIAKIVGSLRSFAGLDEAELRRVDVRDGIESAITLLSHLMANRIAVVKEFGDVPRILCYASELNQAFMNILRNACEAIEGTGMIRVATSKDVDGVRIEISDNGKGMAEEELKSLFDFQFSSRRATVRVGMGLKAAYGIIQKHHGSIVVSSVPGKGTKFVITLPIDCNEGVQTLS